VVFNKSTSSTTTPAWCCGAASRGAVRFIADGRGDR
jgi:hypothetical protein